MKRVVIVGDGRREPIVRAVHQLRPWLEARARVVSVDLAERLDLSRVKADLALIFGGDGTILSTARRMGARQIPALGVNFGKFGFLADTAEEDLRAAVAAALAGRLRESRRLMLQCTVRRGKRVMGRFLALNDAVVTRGTIARVIALAVSIGGTDVGTVLGDGMIVATPVGSTAHSLSAGGPILHPELDALVLTPLCPHALGMRPIVVRASEEVSLHVTQMSEETVLTLDGQVSTYLREQDVVRVTRAPFMFRHLRAGGRDFFGTLREKFAWGSRPGYAREAAEDGPPA
jgi:NAD+ kinase